MHNIVTTKMFGQQLNLGHWSTDGLAFYWRGIPAGNVVDESPYGNHGTITGATWVGNGLLFNGVANDLVNCGTNDSLNLTGNFTIIVRAAPGDITLNDNTIIGRSGPTHWWMLMNGAGGDNGRIALFLSGSKLHSIQCWTANDQQRTIAVTHNGSLVTFYRDGVFLSSAASSNASSAAGATTYIGIDPRDAVGLGFNGSIEYIWIYNRVLSASEIQQLYINPELPIQQDPVWSLFTPAAAAGLSGIYYRTLMQGVS